MNRAASIVAASLVLGWLAFSQEFAQLRMDLVAKDYTYTEGPAWSKDGYLIFSDTPGNQLLKWIPGHPAEVFRENANGPSGNAFDVEGRLYTCETRTRRVTRTDKSGKVDVLVDKFEGKRLNAPNDIVVAKAGNVYFTDPAFGWQSDSRELDFYGVFQIPVKGGLKVVARSKGRPNGIALSPSGKVLYVSNSDERNVRAYDIDKNGDASNERILIDKVDGIPGGLCVDEKGQLFVAARGVAIYSPEGKLVHTIATHNPASNCGFAEGDLKSLMITSRGELFRTRLEVKGAY